MSQLRKTRLIHTNSRLARLNPSPDQNGILRMGLRYAHLNFDEKFPIILPDGSPFVGAQLMVNVINRRFWIVGARDQIRQQIHKCITCYRQRAAVQKQLIGDLPAFRVAASRLFTYTGVDWLKAIHIELVTDLNSEGLMAAYGRFSTRRGRCKVLYCDNGTNFAGASKELAKQHKQMLQQLKSDLAQVLEHEGVVFKFIPPGSAHFGGLWEAGVRSTKQHLKRILGNARLTYEEFSTVLTQIEACQNSRPLCEVSRNSDAWTFPDWDEKLPPSRWLMGRITEIHSGLDGLVRHPMELFELKTKDNMLKRSIAKICLLPVDTMENYDETKTQSIETD
ncbi:uncharacterized protein LOC129615113 [Condylostylus longicornis]|uniref:uncharacterized protein LOC129615113 n=1 Tax=Condylostylus longicornis TaxID=2530218 RepID=UPI00244DEA46|nr:uncharacterized protein LOC129615113 [Condylostylus longicornis]